MLEEKLREIAELLESHSNSHAYRTFEDIETLIPEKFSTSNDGWVDVIVYKNVKETVIVRFASYEHVEDGLVVLAQRHGEGQMRLLGKAFAKVILYFSENENIDRFRSKPDDEEDRAAFLEQRTVFLLDVTYQLHAGPAIEALRENSII